MANVNDFECTEFPDDLMSSIFQHQHELAIKYIPIEKKNGLCLYDQVPAEIDDAKAQARIKDMSWRAVEEVAEAFEALDLKEYTHFYEEMADALHFLVEKYLLCNFFPFNPISFTEYFISSSSTITPRPSITSKGLESFFSDAFQGEHINLPDGEEMSWVKRRNLDCAMANFIKCCGLTCNCLKNKPWKQSQMLTDVSKFRVKLLEEFRSFIDLCNEAGFTAESLYSMYMRKNQVNCFRQRSNY